MIVFVKIPLQMTILGCHGETNLYKYIILGILIKIYFYLSKASAYMLSSWTKFTNFIRKALENIDQFVFLDVTGKQFKYEALDAIFDLDFLKF